MGQGHRLLMRVALCPASAPGAALVSRSSALRASLHSGDRRSPQGWPAPSSSSRLMGAIRKWGRGLEIPPTPIVGSFLRIWGTWFFFFNFCPFLKGKCEPHVHTLRPVPHREIQNWTRPPAWHPSESPGARSRGWAVPCPVHASDALRNPL